MTDPVSKLDRVLLNQRIMLEMMVKNSLTDADLRRVLDAARATTESLTGMPRLSVLGPVSGDACPPCPRHGMMARKKNVRTHSQHKWHTTIGDDGRPVSYRCGFCGLVEKEEDRR